MTYNHAFTIAFEIESGCPEGSDITHEMAIEALRRRIAEYEGNGGLVPLDIFDSFEVEDD